MVRARMTVETSAPSFSSFPLGCYTFKACTTLHVINDLNLKGKRFAIYIFLHFQIAVYIGAKDPGEFFFASIQVSLEK